jgi:hypothetical protein
MVFVANNRMRVAGPVDQKVFVLAPETNIGSSRFQITIGRSVQFAHSVFKIKTIFADITTI